MKLVNCKVGTKVMVKGPQKASSALRFWISSIDQVCTITKVPDEYGDVQVQVDSTGKLDVGHHTNLRKYKGETA